MFWDIDRVLNHTATPIVAVTHVVLSHLSLGLHHTEYVLAQATGILMLTLGVGNGTLGQVGHVAAIHTVAGRM